MLFLLCSHVFSLSPFLCPCYCVFLVLMCPRVATCSNVVFSQKLFAISFDLIIGHRFISMAEPRFTLFLVVQKCQWNAFDSIGIFPISIVNPRGLILISRASVRSCDARAVLYQIWCWDSRIPHSLPDTIFSSRVFALYNHICRP